MSSAIPCFLFSRNFLAGLKKKKDIHLPKDNRRRQIFEEQTRLTIEHLYNHPCIVAYTIFNEGWGQFDAAGACKLILSLDDTRPIDHASGWHDQKIGDIRSWHVYFRPYQFKKDKLAYIPQVAKLKEGNDYYIGSLKSAKKVVEHLKEEFGGTSKESPRLISEDKSTGKGLYRIWIALRLPKFVKEDFVKYHDNVYQVSDVDGNRIQVINLENQDIISLKWREYDSIEKIEHLEGVQKAIITAKSPSMMQILDPDDYSPIDLEMNENMEKYNIGEEIDVIKIDGKIYII